MSSGGAYLRNDFLSSGGDRCIRNGRRTTVENPPRRKGGAEFDLGVARRAAYVAKSEGRDFQRLAHSKDKSLYYL